MCPLCRDRGFYYLEPAHANSGWVYCRCEQCRPEPEELYWEHPDAPICFPEINLPAEANLN